MQFSRVFFEDRLRERLLTAGGHATPAPAPALEGWDAARVLEFLRQNLDSEPRTLERAVIVGAGGHAKVVIEILEETGEYALAGCTSKGPAGQLLGLPVLGTDDVLPELHAAGVRHAFVAVGDNRARRELTGKLAALGFHLVNAVSRRAAVSPRARLGRGVAVMPGAVANGGAEIGDGAIVNTGATVDHDCRVGAWAHIAPGAHLAGGVAVGEGALVGIGSSAIEGVSIGAWTVVGAGAAVICDLPPGVAAVGVPARVLEAAGGARGSNLS